jgi:hypothetical protein
MNIRANSDPKFYLRFLIIGLIVGGFSLYCVYDGAYGYPQQAIRAHKYEEFEKEKRLEEWPAFALERGWSTDPPGEPKTPVDFQLQFIMGGVTGALCLWFLLIVFRNRGRWIEASKSGITSSWGQQLNYADVVALDKKQWNKKGIAKVYYQEDGRRRRFVIDDFKFMRGPTGEILRALEARIDPNMITGGLPEGAEEAYEEYDEQGESAAATG